MTPSIILRRGFSLIELMLALGIMSVGLMMVGTTLPAGIMNSDESNLQTNATIISDNAATILRNELHNTVLKNWFIRKYGQLGFVDARFMELTQSRNSIVEDPQFPAFMTDTGLVYAERFYPRPTGAKLVLNASMGDVDTDWLRMWPNDQNNKFDAGAPLYKQDQQAKANAVTLGPPATTFFNFTDASTKYLLQPASRFAWMVLARPAVIAPVQKANLDGPSTFTVSSRSGIGLGRIWVTNSGGNNGDYRVTNVVTDDVVAHTSILTVSPAPPSSGASGGSLIADNDYEFLIVPVRRHMSEDPLLEITFWPGQITAAGQFVFINVSNAVPNALPKGTLIIASGDNRDNSAPPKSVTAGDFGWILDDIGTVYRQGGAPAKWPATPGPPSNVGAYAVMDVPCAPNPDGTVPGTQARTCIALGVSRIRTSVQP